jgi:hypothetical protein
MRWLPVHSVQGKPNYHYSGHEVAPDWWTSVTDILLYPVQGARQPTRSTIATLLLRGRIDSHLGVHQARVLVQDGPPRKSGRSHCTAESGCAQCTSCRLVPWRIVKCSSGRDTIALWKGTSGAAETSWRERWVEMVSFDRSLEDNADLLRAISLLRAVTR